MIVAIDEMAVYPGQLWMDRDVGTSYDTLPDGTYPIPEDYTGLLGLRPRIVEVLRVDGCRLHARNLHNGRLSRIKVSAFARPSEQRGFTLIAEPVRR